MSTVSARRENRYKTNPQDENFVTIKPCYQDAGVLTMRLWLANLPMERFEVRVNEAESFIRCVTFVCPAGCNLTRHQQQTLAAAVGFGNPTQSSERFPQVSPVSLLA